MERAGPGARPRRGPLALLIAPPGVEGRPGPVLTGEPYLVAAASRHLTEPEREEVVRMKPAKRVWWFQP